MADGAYILIETNVGASKKVVEAIQKLDGVESVYQVTGPYDVIATVEGTDLRAIGSIVTEKIHPIIGISRTVTCLKIGSV